MSFTNIFSNVLPVTIGTGNAAKHYQVSRALLKAKTQYFENALLANENTPDKGTVKFPDVRPIVFDFYYPTWVSGEFKVPNCTVTVTERRDWEAQAKVFRFQLRLIRMYILGELLGDTEFMDLTIDAIATSLTTYGFSASKLLVEIYAKSIPGSQVRRLFVAVIAAQFKPGYFDSVKNIPIECYRDVLNEMAHTVAILRGPDYLYDNHMGWKEWLKWSIDDFHVHPAEVVQSPAGMSPAEPMEE